MRDNNGTAAYNCWKGVSSGMVSKNMRREENENLKKKSLWHLYKII